MHDEAPRRTGDATVRRMVGSVLEGCSVEAREVVSAASHEARRLGHARVGTEHLLLGLLAVDESEPAAALRAAGVTLAAARYTVSELAPHGDTLPGDGELPLTSRAQRALERAGRFSRRDLEPEVSASYVLLGVLDVEGLACQVLRGLGIDLAGLRDTVIGAPVGTAAAATEVTADVATAAPALDHGQRPHCPQCRSDLDGHLVATVVAARVGGGSDTHVNVLHCDVCGVALGVLPTDG